MEGTVNVGTAGSDRRAVAVATAVAVAVDSTLTTEERPLRPSSES